MGKGGTVSNGTLVLVHLPGTEEQREEKIDVTIERNGRGRARVTDSNGLIATTNGAEPRERITLTGRLAIFRDRARAWLE